MNVEELLRQAEAENQMIEQGGVQEEEDDRSLLSSFAPAIGGTVGGIGGFALGGPAGAVAGGALGSGLGEAVGQTASDEDPDLGGVAKEAALGGAFGALPVLGHGGRLGRAGLQAARGSGSQAVKTATQGGRLFRGGQAAGEAAEGAAQRAGRFADDATARRQEPMAGLARRGQQAERTGGRLMASQANLTRPQMRKMNLDGNRTMGDVFNNLRQKTGLRKLDDMSDTARMVTGSDGALSELNRNAIGNSSGVKLPSLRERAGQLLSDKGTAITGSRRNQLLERFRRDSERAFGGSRGSVSPRANTNEVYDMAREWQGEAARIRGMANPTRTDLQEASIFEDMAKETLDAVYKSPGISEGLRQAKPAAVAALRQDAMRLGGSRAKALNKIADQVENLESPQQVRSFMKDFVDVGEIQRLSEAAAQGAGAQLGGQFTGLGASLNRPMAPLARGAQAASPAVGQGMSAAGAGMQRLGSALPQGTRPFRQAAGQFGGRAMTRDNGDTQPRAMGGMGQVDPITGEQAGAGTITGQPASTLPGSNFGTDTTTTGVGTQQPSYTLENALADMQRDPANADYYEQLYNFVQESQVSSEDQAQADQTAQVAGIVTEDTQRALDIINDRGRLASGVGSFSSFIPESPAAQLQAHIDSIKGNIGVDQLIEIKKQGSGLGQVPQAQLNMLSELLGSLDSSLPPDQIAFNLQRVQDIYSDIARKAQQPQQAGASNTQDASTLEQQLMQQNPAALGAF